MGLSAIVSFMQGSDSTPLSQHVKKRSFYGLYMPRVPILWKTSSMPLQRQIRCHSGDVIILGPHRKTQKGHFWKKQGGLNFIWCGNFGEDGHGLRSRICSAFPGNPCPCLALTVPSDWFYQSQYHLVLERMERFVQTG